MTWFKRTSTELEATPEKRVRTEGLWVKCENCRQVIWKKDMDANLSVCPKCDKHFRITAEQRLNLLLDNEQWDVFDDDLASTDPLKFTDTKAYSDRLVAAQNSTGLRDAILNAEGKIEGRDVIVSAMEYSFIGGSMGAVVGEAITRAVERGVKQGKPVIVVSASGGARMMEGVVSLMQMAKISAALAKPSPIKRRPQDSSDGKRYPMQ
jgi:acetyl-CoA carboxylase carboxyl transferase subunit beta